LSSHRATVAALFAASLGVGAACAKPLTTPHCTASLPEKWVVTAEGRGHSADGLVSAVLDEVPFGNLVVEAARALPGTDVHSDAAMAWAVSSTVSGSLIVTSIEPATPTPACHVVVQAPASKEWVAEAVARSVQRR
jgi:hypothetical protein